MQRKQDRFIVFDLDETLVHTFSTSKGYEKAREKAKENKELEERLFYFELDGEFYWGVMRPHAKEILKVLKNYYKIAVWSAGTRDYVEEIIKIIFDYPQKPYVVWARDKCEELPDHSSSLNNQYDSINKKPLYNLWRENPSMNRSNTLIIDDREDVSDHNILNHIHIPVFRPVYDNVEISDNALVGLRDHLIDKHDIGDLRIISGIRFVTK